RSILAGDVTGTSFPQDSTGKVSVQNGPAVNGHMPSQFSYSLGADIGVTKRLTLAFDYLGQTVFKAPRVFTTFAPDPSNNKAVSLPDIMGVKRTTTLYSGAAGLKYNLFGG